MSGDTIVYKNVQIVSDFPASLNDLPLDVKKNNI